MGEETEVFGYYVGSEDKRCEYDIKNNIYPCDLDRELFSNKEDSE